MKCIRTTYTNFKKTPTKLVRVDECQKDYICSCCRVYVPLGSPCFVTTTRLTYKYNAFKVKRFCVKCSLRKFKNILTSNKLSHKYV